MKKINTKSILAAAFAATVMAVSSSASLSAYAESSVSNEEFGGDYATVNSDDYQRYLGTLSDEQLQLIAEKERVAAKFETELSTERYATTRAATLIGVPGTFTIYQQETNTYCVPACIKSVLMYTTNSSPSQASIDSTINMNFTKIPDYVNARQSKCNYVLSTSPTQSTLTSHIKSDITSWEVPSFLRISGTSETSWYYATNGHCVLSNGIYDDQSIVLIADPLGERVTDCPYFYEKPASTVANYTTHQCW